MSLLRDVVSVLDAEAVPHALIGAAALAVHGVARSTADVDLLVVDTRCSLLDIAPDRPSLVSAVEQALPRLPADARRLWKKIRTD